MSDLIERKDLGAAIDNWLAIDRYYHPYSKQKTIPVSELVDIIKLLPTAEPEIVRCKDCMYWCNHKRLNIPWCRELHIDMGAEDFCSMAKRRKE